MHEVMYVVKDYKGGRIIATRPPTDDELKQANKVRWALRCKALEDEAQYELEHSQGYCPHCYGLKALNGKCMNGCED